MLKLILENSVLEYLGTSINVVIVASLLVREGDSKYVYNHKAIYHYSPKAISTPYISLDWNFNLPDIFELLLHIYIVTVYI